MENQFNKIGGRIALAFLVIMFFIALYKGYLLRHDYKFTTGKVTEITPPGSKSSGDYSILFEYWVNGKAHHNNDNYNYCGDLSMPKVRALLVGKTFPVVYAAKDFSTSVILLTEEQAKAFHYRITDSFKYYDSVLTCKY